MKHATRPIETILVVRLNPRKFIWLVVFELLQDNSVFDSVAKAVKMLSSSQRSNSICSHISCFVLILIKKSPLVYNKIIRFTTKPISENTYQKGHEEWPGKLGKLLKFL